MSCFFARIFGSFGLKIFEFSTGSFGATSCSHVLYVFMCSVFPVTKSAQSSMVIGFRADRPHTKSMSSHTKSMSAHTKSM